MSNKNWRFETKQLHVGQEQADPVTDSRAVPIYASTSFVFHNSQHAADRFGLRDAGNIYGRLTNPTEDIFEQRIAALEGGVAALGGSHGCAAKPPLPGEVARREPRRRGFCKSATTSQSACG